MTDHSRQDLWQLILQYEDLAPDQRLIADQALAADPDLQRDWTRLLALEDQAQLSWSAKDQDFWHPKMDEDIADQCRASLTSILAHLPKSGDQARSPAGVSPFVEGNPSARPRRRFPRRMPHVLWPLAAVLALVMLFPRLTPNTYLIDQLAVRTVEIAGDGTRSVESAAPTAGQLATGQAFVLSLAPMPSGWLVVYHVDPLGKYARVFADAVANEDEGQTIPSAASGDFWVLDGEPGRESFVVGATTQTAPDLNHLAEAIVQQSVGTQNHAEVVTAIATAMDKILTEVQVLTFDHVD